MGLAFGLLGVLTFASMFGLGYCLTSRKQLKDKNAELEERIRFLEQMNKGGTLD